MSNFLKYMRLFALGITFSSSMALPYVQIKFYDVFREATQASNNELGLLMTIFTAVSMALYIPGGVLADRGSPKKLLLLSLIMMCGLNATLLSIPPTARHSSSGRCSPFPPT